MADSTVHSWEVETCAFEAPTDDPNLNVNHFIFIFASITTVMSIKITLFLGND
jgi:hypothetical protein